MIKFLKSKNPLAVILYPVISFSVVFFFYGEANGYGEEKVFVLDFLTGKIETGYYFYLILSVFVLTVAGIFYNNTVKRLKPVKSYGHFHGFLFIIFSATFAGKINILQIGLSLVFFMMFMYFIINSFRKENAVFDYFNAGLSLAVSSFFWFNSLFFFPVVIAGLLIFRKLNLREILTALTGVVLPYYILISVYFIFTSDFGVLFDISKTIFSYTPVHITEASSVYVFLPVVFMLLISSFYLISRYRNTESDIQDYYIFFFSVFIFTILYFTAVKNGDINVLPFMLIPVTVPIGLYFSDKKGYLFKEIIFDLFIAVLILSYYGIL